jgi:hypothetical protein
MRQMLVVQPLQVIETPTDVVGVHVSPSDNLDRTMRLH